MARNFPRVSRSVASNPSVFGFDAVDLAGEAVGVGLAALVDERVAAPLARQVIPSLGGRPERAWWTARDVFTPTTPFRACHPIDQSILRRVQTALRE